MPQPVVPSTMRLAATILQSNGDVNVNVVHFQLSAIHPSVNMAVVLDSIYVTAWQTSVRIHQSANDKLVQVAVTDLTVSPYYTLYFAHAIAGTGGGNDLPRQVAACISLSTGYGGRSGKGRIFIGSLTATSLDATGALTSTVQTDLNQFATDLVTGGTSGGVTGNLAVYSRSLGVSHLVVAHAVNSRADTQRRRANRRLY